MKRTLASRDRRCLVVGLALSMSACTDRSTSEEAAEEEPQWEIVQSRLEPCELYCEAALDPACPSQHYIDQGLTTVAACANACASTKEGWSREWLPADDGSGDLCAPEKVAKQTCWNSLTCAERYARDPSLCREEKNALRACLQAAGTESGE